MSGAITTTAFSANDASAAAASAKERALLAKLLRTYQADIDKGQSADQLKPLGNQITDAGKQLGQNVTPPKATASSASADGAASASAADASDGTKVNLSA